MMMCKIELDGIKKNEHFQDVHEVSSQQSFSNDSVEINLYDGWHEL